MPYGQLLALLFCSISCPTSCCPVPQRSSVFLSTPIFSTCVHHPRDPSETPYFIAPDPMSASTQTTSLLTDSFTTIFSAATSEFQRVTGKSLDSHPLAAQLETCNSPEAVSTVLRNQAEAFEKFSKGDKRLMAWLDPTIQILSIFSATLGDGIGLVRLVTRSL